MTGRIDRQTDRFGRFMKLLPFKSETAKEKKKKELFLFVEQMPWSRNVSLHDNALVERRIQHMLHARYETEEEGEMIDVGSEVEDEFLSCRWESRRCWRERESS